MFEVRQKVVCIHQDRYMKRLEQYGNTIPTIGEVYTIRTIEPPLRKEHTDPCYFRLMEIKNLNFLYINGEGECEFGSMNFRPLVSDHTEFFRALTAPSELSRFKDSIDV